MDAGWTRTRDPASNAAFRIATGVFAAMADEPQAPAPKRGAC